MQSELLKFQNLIRAVVRNVAGHALDSNDLQDIIQETNIRILTNTFDPARGSMAGWVSSIAHNQAISALRRMSRHVQPSSDYLAAAENGGADPDDTTFARVTLDYLAMADPAAEDIIHVLMRERLAEKVEAVLGQLRPDDLHFLIISCRDDYSNSDYAKKLGVTEVALRIRKMRLGEKLRVMLAGLDS